MKSILIKPAYDLKNSCESSFQNSRSEEYRNTLWKAFLPDLPTKLVSTDCKTLFLCHSIRHAPFPWVLPNIHFQHLKCPRLAWNTFSFILFPLYKKLFLVKCFFSFFEITVSSSLYNMRLINCTQISFISKLTRWSKSTTFVLNRSTLP